MVAKFALLFLFAGVVSCVVEVDDIAAVEKNEINDPSGLSKVNGTGCSCIGYNCGCCAYFNVPDIGLNDTGCVNVTYLPKPEYGIAVLFSLNGRVVFNYSVSVRNPPPLCFGVPYLTKLARLCVRFYDLTYNDSSLSGCVRVEVKLARRVVEKYNLGCFRIPPTEPKSQSPARVAMMEIRDTVLKYIPRKKAQIASRELWKKMSKVAKNRIFGLKKISV